jgi:hypothetical protein
MKSETATEIRPRLMSYGITAALALAFVATVISAVSAAGKVGFVDESVPQIVKINGP